MKKLILVIFVLVAGCGTTAEPTRLADGSEGHRVDCSGEALNMGSCFQKAGETCGSNGYSVIEKSQETPAINIPGKGLARYLSNAGNQRYLLIKCNKPKQ